MNYKNGREVLPPRLLEELQQYIQGELLYIPKPEQARTPWGELSGSRLSLNIRNQEIYDDYCNGQSVKVLATSYHLSEESIRKIISKLRDCEATATLAYTHA